MDVLGCLVWIFPTKKQLGVDLVVRSGMISHEKVV